jgi:hypothetical protein
MLAEMAPAEMDERIAAEVIEEEKRNRVVEVLKLVGAAIAAASGVKLSPDAFEPDRRRILTAAPSTMPAAHIDSTSDIMVSPDQAVALLSTTMGPPDRK